SRTGGQPETVVNRILAEEILEPQGRTAGIVAEPVRLASRKNCKVAGPQIPQLGIAVDLQPAAPGRDDVKRGETVGPHTEAPGRPKLGAAAPGPRSPKHP